MAGKFIISLDFELHWGGAHQWDLKKMHNYFLDGRKAVVQMLDLFQQHQVRATWATVGYLFAKDKEQLLSYCPDLKPSYTNGNISAYHYFDQVGKNEQEDPFHFGGSLIQEILNTPGQELATHTFSHYFCTEEGQTVAQFEADLKAAQKIADENFGIFSKSLVFPRNQYNPEYLKIVRENHIQTLRSNPDVWFWNKSYGKFTPLFRAADTLISISSGLSFDGKDLEINHDILEIPASRFFRPYIKKEEFFQALKMKRIKTEMLQAAKNNKIYHLWWHPHNFGNDLQRNMLQLKEILAYFTELKELYGFQSANMIDLKKD